MSLRPWLTLTWTATPSWPNRWPCTRITRRVGSRKVDPSGQTITFWHNHPKERETALLEIVDEFNKTNEWGITVVAEYQGCYNDIFNKMPGLLNTADVPDLVVAYQNQAATYQLGDGLIDMNTW